MDSVALPHSGSVKETPDRLAVCTVERTVTHRLHLNVVAELLRVIPGSGSSLCDRDRPEVKELRRDPKAVVSSHGEPITVPAPRVR